MLSRNFQSNSEHKQINKHVPYNGMGAPKQSVHNGLGAGQDTAGQGNESTQRGFLGEVALEMAELE